MPDRLYRGATLELHGEPWLVERPTRDANAWLLRLLAPGIPVYLTVTPRDLDYAEQGLRYVSDCPKCGREITVDWDARDDARGSCDHGFWEDDAPMMPTTQGKNPALDAVLDQLGVTTTMLPDLKPKAEPQDEAAIITCSVCTKPKDKELFQRNRAGKRISVCKTCMRQKQQHTMQQQQTVMGRPKGTTEKPLPMVIPLPPIPEPVIPPAPTLVDRLESQVMAKQQELVETRARIMALADDIKLLQHQLKLAKKYTPDELQALARALRDDLTAVDALLTVA